MADNGLGLPTDLNPQEPATLGLQLVHMLTKQLGGTVAFARRHGTTVDVQMPR